jgi:hypothetical protein
MRVKFLSAAAGPTAAAQAAQAAGLPWGSFNAPAAAAKPPPCRLLHRATTARAPPAWAAAFAALPSPLPPVPLPPVVWVDSAEGLALLQRSLQRWLDDGQAESNSAGGGGGRSSGGGSELRPGQSRLCLRRPLAFDSEFASVSGPGGHRVAVAATLQLADEDADVMYRRQLGALLEWAWEHFTPVREKQKLADEVKSITYIL